MTERKKQHPTYLKIAYLVVAWNKPPQIHCTSYKWIWRKIYFIIIIIVMSAALSSLLADFMHAYRTQTHSRTESKKTTHLSRVTHSDSTNKNIDYWQKMEQKVRNPMHTELFSYTLLVNRVIGDTFEFYCPELYMMLNGSCSIHVNKNNTLTHCLTANGGSEKVCESVYPALLF